AIAAQQGKDGRFATKSDRPERTTALAVLAFLSEGHSSRGGAYREIVASGVEWLRKQPLDALVPEDRAIALLALAEDLMLAQGSLTPAESVARGREVASLARAVAAARTKTPADSAASAWSALALSSTA